MANVNIVSTTEVFNSRLWGGVSEDDTAWLQSPMGSNSVTGTISMAVVDMVMEDGTSDATQYDLALTSNPVVGAELIGVLSIHNTTTAAGITLTALEHTSTLIKFTTDSDGVNNDVIRVVFLYR